ncbi:MAG: hypothetical protein ACRDTQ_14435 [Micromonosporaceae bacterium]
MTHVAVLLRALRILMWPNWSENGAWRRPITVIEGTRGSGKTVHLDTIAARIERVVPYGRFDFSRHSHADVPRVLSALAAGLSRYRPRYGRIPFPRLLIGLLVVEHHLTDGNFEKAREEIKQVLRQRRTQGWARRFFSATAGEIELSPPMRLGFILRLQLPFALIGEFFDSNASSRFRAWYGHRDQGKSDDPVDALIALNTAAHDTEDDSGNRKLRDELLCEAFLADLRHCPQRVRRLLSPVILLDDVDTEAGRVFLRRLVEARPSLARRDLAEPLTVVATSNGRLLETVEAPVAPVLDLLKTDQKPSDPAPMWLVYRLPALSRTDIEDAMTGASGSSQSVDSRLARLIHLFTAGHPEAAATLARVASARPSPAGGVGELLSLPAPDRDPGDPATVQDVLLRRLLDTGEGPWDDRVAAFATCAAARTEAEMLQLASGNGLADSSWASELQRLRLWDSDGEPGAVVLRRLLLRRLAARPRDGNANWSAVHQRLLAHARRHDRQDLLGELYHRLADGDLVNVAGELLRMVRERPARDWLQLLHAVVEAPCGEPDQPGLAPHARFHGLVAGQQDGPPDTASAVRLVAALWIVTDPRNGPERRFLHKTIAQELRSLAQLSPSGLVELFREAEEHDKQAKLWT